MNVLLTIVLAVQMLTALGMIGLILLQHGKGADMGAAFGSGASGSLFGATGSANFLSRSTAVAASLFFVCTIALAYFGFRVDRSGDDGASVFDRPQAAAASAPAVASAPAIAASATKGAATGGAVDLIPGAVPAAANASAPAAAAASAVAASGKPAAGAASAPSK